MPSTHFAAIGSVVLFVCLASSAFGRAPEESPDGPEAVKVYLTEEEALAKAFPGADSIQAAVWAPNSGQRRRIEQRLGWRLEAGPFTVYAGYLAGVVVGYSTVGEEVGLYRPITFMVKVSPEGKVDGVWVMVYRESRGGEVRRRRFLAQYDGKTADSPMRINRDIIGVTGATLSVRALNAGVKKAATLIEVGFIAGEGT
jgi:thiamine biosynthesis lipoprotein